MGDSPQSHPRPHDPALWGAAVVLTLLLGAGAVLATWPAWGLAVWMQSAGRFCW